MRNLLILMLFFSTNCVFAYDFGGVDFKDSLNIDRTSKTIQLNGVGYRTKFFFKIYMGALYLEEKVSSRNEAQNLTGPKRIEMRFVYDEVSREKLVNGWNEGFENNNNTEQLQLLGERIKKFNNYFETLVEGDVVLMDYLPGIGTQVTIKGDKKDIIKGEDFYAALLDIWLGDDPADDDLKEDMLGL